MKKIKTHEAYKYPRICIILKKETIIKLKLIAANQGSTMSRLAREIIEDYLDEKGGPNHDPFVKEAQS